MLTFTIKCQICGSDESYLDREDLDKIMDIVMRSEDFRMTHWCESCGDTIKCNIEKKNNTLMC
jgi:hypothetical protein